MNALQRLELLSEHAELVQVIPTLKGMAKLDSLERLSEIVELLGGKVQDEAPTPEQNIAKGKQAMQSVITNHQDVKHAMYRDDIGWIDFVWGEVGEIKPNGKTKGGKGISHIIEARMRKNQLSYDEVISMLNNEIVNAISQGVVTDRVEENNEIKLKLDNNGFRAVLLKEQENNAWLLTGFELSEDESGKVHSKTTPTEHQSYTSRTDAGASDKDTIPQNDNDVNSGALSQVNSDKPQEIDVSAIDTDLSSYLAKHDNLQSATHEFFKDHLKGKVIKTVIGDVHILGSSWKHKLKQGIHKDELKAKAIPFIPQILSQGKYEQDRDKYKERTDVYVAFHAFFKEVQIDDELVGVRLLVGERENNEYEFVVYNAYPNAQMDALKNPNLSDTGNARAVLGFDNILLDEADDVNDEYDDVEFDDSTASLFDGLMLDDLGLDGVLFDDIEDDTDGWNIQIISITPIQSKEQALFGKTKPVDRNKLYNAGLRLVYADDYSMWSNGHILVKENVSDELIAQASNAKKMPVSQLERVIPAKNTQFKLADLATTTNGKKTQLAVLQDEQGNELAVNKSYLQFFIKEFGNGLEYWTNGLDASPIAIYKGGELVGLIMPMQNTQYEKHSEQEPKQDKPVISELVNPYDESQVQAKLDKVKQEYENFGEKSLSPYEKMPANGITVELANARQFLLDKVLKGKDKNVIFTFTDENGNMAYKVGADTRANRSKLINAFGEIDSTKLPNEQLYGQVNGGNIASAKILERLGYQINHTEKDTFYPKNTLPVKNQVYQIDLHGNKGVYLFVGIDNKQQLKDEAELRFLDLESDYLMSMGANRYDELMNAGKIVKVDDMATITKLVNHNAKKEHSIYQTRANGTMIKVFAVGNRYRIETYKNKDDRYPNSHTVNDKDEATAYLQREKENYPALKFITGVENLLDREIGSDKADESQKPEHSPSNEDSAGALMQNEQENTMNEQQNPNYTQSDIDYLQSIINGTLDLDTVDMDKMIEIGEKDEHDPMYEQALQVVSDYLDKMTAV